MFRSILDSRVVLILAFVIAFQGCKEEEDPPAPAVNKPKALGEVLFWSNYGGIRVTVDGEYYGRVGAAGGSRPTCGHEDLRGGLVVELPWGNHKLEATNGALVWEGNVFFYANRCSSLQLQ